MNCTSIKNFSVYARPAIGFQKSFALLYTGKMMVYTRYYVTLYCILQGWSPTLKVYSQ